MGNIKNFIGKRQIKVPFIDLSAQYLTIKDDIIHVIQEVLKSGRFILGEELISFEEEFARYCGVKYAIGVGSGTEALHLSLLACGVELGDEVITVPNTAVPTVSAINFANAQPVFVDIDPQTYTMDPNRLEDYLKRRSSLAKVKVVIPVHLYGHPVDMDSILEITQKYGLKVIEDVCQAQGAEYKGKKVGSISDTGCFSFYPTKNLGAYGDGGMVGTNNIEIAKKLKMLRNYGEERKNYNLIKGFNSRLDELQAAVLRIKLKYVDQWNERRREHAFLYDNLLKDSALKLPIEREYAKHVFHLYVVRVQKRSELQDELRTMGIETSIHYPLPIHFQKAYKDLGYIEGDFPVAEKYSKEIISLPMFAELEKDDIEYVCQAIREFQ